MNIYHKLLEVCRTFYCVSARKPRDHRNWKQFSTKEYANELLSDFIISGKPFMSARFGSTEMENLVNYVGIKQHNKDWKSYIKDKSLPWWWNPKNSDELFYYSGFFPNDVEYVFQFCELMINCMPNVDVLGSWLNDEWIFKNELKNAKRAIIEDLEPFFCQKPWTHSLKGKNVLVIHPFADTIVEQYKKKDLIFPNGLLPDFNLQTLKAVQTLCGIKTEFATWFDALKFMQDKIDQIEFDLAIIGCGAYGFPLASYIKSKGKQAIHLGGVTQLLFGIIGSRYEGPHAWPYMNLFNEYWTRPSEIETPKESKNIEGNCYW